MRSFFSQVMLTVALPLLAIQLLLGYVYYHVSNEDLLREFEKESLIIKAGIAEPVVSLIRRGDIASGIRIVEYLRSNPDVDHALISTDAGPLFHFDHHGKGEFPDLHAEMTFAHDILSEEGILGTFQIQFLHEVLNQRRSDIVNSLLLGEGATLVLVLLFCFFVTSRITKPTEILSRFVNSAISMKGMTKERQTLSFQVRELSGLSDGINALLDEVQNSHRALEKSNIMMTEIFINAVDAFVTIDQHGNVLMFNQAASTLFGYAPNEVLGRNVNMLMPEPYKAEHDGYLQRYLETRHAKIIGIGREVIGLKKNGETFPMDLSVSMMLLDDEIQFFGVTRDLSESKRQEAELQKALQQAEESASVKSRFLANMSHEIRTPINGLMSSADLLLDTKLDGEQRDLAETISHSMRSVLTILNDILNLSKIEAGAMKLSCISFDIRRIVRDCFTVFKMALEEKNLTCSENIDVNCPEQFLGDPVRLRQIILNFLSNSVKFTDQGGIELNVKTSLQSDDHWETIIEIRDTGAGMSEEMVGRFFDAFEQEDNSRTRKHDGTGLGTTISRQLVELMGGSVAVESTLGKGTTVRMTLPFKATCKKHVEETPDQLVRDYQKCVLIVEDNKINQKVLGKTLKKLGCDFDVANHGQECLDLVQANEDRYEIILMDISMPVMDGFSACQILRQEKFAFPILAVTANVLTDEEGMYERSGFNDVLCKPVDRKTMILALDQYLGT